MRYSQRVVTLPVLWTCVSAQLLIAQARESARIIGIDKGSQSVVAHDAVSGARIQSQPLDVPVEDFLVAPGGARLVAVHLRATDRNAPRELTLTILDAATLKPVGRASAGWDGSRSWLGWRAVPKSQPILGGCSGPHGIAANGRSYNETSNGFFFSPDGSRLSIVSPGVSDRDTTRDRPGELHTIRLTDGANAKAARLSHPMRVSRSAGVGSIVTMVRALMSDDGAHGVIVHDSSDTHPAELHILDLVEGIERAVVRLPSDPTQARISPDGKRVYVWQGERRTRSDPWRLTIVSLPESRILDSLAWQPSGLEFADAGRDKRIWGDTASYVADDQCGTYMRLSADGNTLFLVGLAPRGPQLSVVDTRTLNQKGPVPLVANAIALSEDGKSIFSSGMTYWAGRANRFLTGFAGELEGAWRPISVLEAKANRYSEEGGYEVLVRRGLPSTVKGKEIVPVQFSTGRRIGNRLIQTGDRIRIEGFADEMFPRDPALPAQGSGILLVDTAGKSHTWLDVPGKAQRIVTAPSSNVIAVLTDKATIVLNRDWEQQHVLPVLRNLGFVALLP